MDTIEGKNINKEKEDLKPLDELILNQYIKYPNKMFYDEGISLEIMREFEIYYCLRSDRIVIPIRDELGSLIGVKSRTTNDKEVEEGYKYLPLYRYPKSKVCYGLYKSLPYIKNEVYVFEAEKSVLKMYSMNIKNTIAIGGMIPSTDQMDKILKLNCDIIFCWDSGLNDDDMKHIREFLDEYKIMTNIYYIYDKWGITNLKDSPCDCGIEVWKNLYNRKFKVSY